jgi:hypothetical protein
LKGDEFIDHWREQNLDSLYHFVRQLMPWGPEGGPGARPPDVSNAIKLDVISFLLQSNGMPAGSSELTAESAAKTLFVGKDGPKPPPNLAHVIAVGCLTSGPNNTWTLTRAANLRRISGDDLSTMGAADRAMAEALPAGDATYRLTSINTVPDFNAAANTGKRIAAQGIYYASESNRRVNATVAIPLPGNCQ